MLFLQLETRPFYQKFLFLKQKLKLEFACSPAHSGDEVAAWQVVNSDPTDVNLQEKTTHRSLSTLVRRKLAFWVIPKS